MTEPVDIKASLGVAARLQAGERVNLADIDPGLQRLAISVAWDAPAEQAGMPVDIDISVFLLTRDGRVRRDSDFVFYNNPTTEKDAVVHGGDVVPAAGQAGGERVVVTSDLLPFDVDTLAVCLSLHNGEERGQSLALVSGARVQIANDETGSEVVSLDLGKGAEDGATALLLGELVRVGASWTFLAVARPVVGGLYQLARGYGVNVAPN